MSSLLANLENDAPIDSLAQHGVSLSAINKLKARQYKTLGDFRKLTIDAIKNIIEGFIITEREQLERARREIGDKSPAELRQQLANAMKGVGIGKPRTEKPEQ